MTIDHGGLVQHCAFSPDGRRIFSASAAGTMKTWDAATGAELKAWKISSHLFSPDWRRAITLTTETARLWDAEKETELAAWKHPGSSLAAAFSADGRRVASASDDNGLIVIDGDTGRVLAALTGHAKRVTSCSFSPDGRRLVSASSDRTLKLWDVDKQVESATMRPVDNYTYIAACAFSPDGRRVVSVSGDSVLKLWDAGSGAEQAVFKGHPYQQGFAFAFSPDGRSLVSAAGDHTLKLWDTETGDEVVTLRGAGAYVRFCAFSADGKRIISAGDRALKIWDAESGAVLTTLEGHDQDVTACAVSPDGGRILSAAWGTLKVWDANVRDESTGHPEQAGKVFACAFSPDGRRIVLGSSDRTLKVWDASTATELITIRGHVAEVTACAFSPDGKRIVSGCAHETLKMWDAETGAELGAIEAPEVYARYDVSISPWGPTSGVFACAFSPDDRLVMYTSFNQTMKFWDTLDKVHVATPEEPDAKITASAFSPDGRNIASFFGLHVPPPGMNYSDSVSLGRTLKIWEASSGTEMVSVRGHEHGAQACAYSPDGTRILACHDETLKIWDARTGAEITTLRGHSSLVNACAFSPDAGSIVSGSSDGTLRLWDAQTGAELACLGHTDEVFTCTFSMDGKLIKSGSWNEIIIWDARERVEIARHILPRRIVDVSSQDGLLTAALTINGDVLILKLENVISGPPIVTAWRHPKLAFGCPLCRSWSEIPETALGAAIQCPVCAADIRLNSFTIDGDWRPIAAAWGRDPEKSQA
ncbi:MAG: hypothetical protein JXE07_00360 [Candidatus Aminicenantes bacterium]|nr:hypothetical protein [Candidatus Aminicenantes bacterium]